MEPAARFLPPDTRLIAYNRAGIGASDSASDRRSLQDLAADLTALAASLNYRRLVLIGHSWGGPIVRRAVLDLPDATALLLVDPSDEHLLADFKPWLLACHRAALRILNLFGLSRLLFRPLLAPLLEDLRRLAEAEIVSPQAIAAMCRELRTLREGLRVLPGLPAHLKPTVLLSGRLALQGESARLRQKIIRAHEKSVQIYGWTCVPACESGHQIPLTQPQLLMQQAQRLLNISN